MNLKLDLHYKNHICFMNQKTWKAEIAKIIITFKNIDKVLSMPAVLNIAGSWIWIWFWMCQSFGYTRGFNMPVVLNMPGFWISQGFEYARVTQGSEYAWIIPEYAWLCMDMSEYAWICRNMREYAKICLNGLCLLFPHFSISLTIFFLLEHVVTYWKVYRRLQSRS